MRGPLSVQRGQESGCLGGLAFVEQRQRQVVAVLPGRIERSDAPETVDGLVIVRVLAQKYGDRILACGWELVGILQTLNAAGCLIRTANPDLRFDQSGAGLRIVVD